MLQGTGASLRAIRRAVSGVRVACALLAALLLAAVTLEAASAQVQPTRRIALVIGNATYTNGGVLDNPEADADLVSAKLSELGFQVTVDKNLGQGGMRDLIGGFMSRVQDGDMVVIYYAGHGIEMDGRDYMLPVDVKLETPTAVQFQGIPLDMLYSSKQTFGVVIVFDACRDNPFLRRVKGEVAGTHALSPPVGALVLFAASSGDVAQDGGTEADGSPLKNSIFASAFVRALSVPGASVQRIYQTTLRDVRARTSNLQAPQRFGDLAEDFTFNPAGRITYAAAPPQPALAPPPTAGPAPEQTRLAAVITATPPGTVFRSFPEQGLATDAAPTESAGAPPSTSMTLPARTAPPVETAPPPPIARPAPQTAAPQTPAPPIERPPAAAPTPEPRAEPQQLASLTTASPATRPASGPPMAAPQPMPDMRFSIASLGENVMPPAPQLQATPVLTLPARFCSVEAQIEYLKSTFKPAYDIAYRNNEIAIAYLSALNTLGAEYNSRGSGFVFRIKAQFEAFAPIAAQANTTSNEVLGLDAQIRRIPVEACTGAG